MYSNLLNSTKDKRDTFPIFIISYNRPEFLKRTLRSYSKLKSVGDVIVHDNGSDDLKTLELLSALEQNGVIVHRCKKIFSQKDLNSVNITIEDYFNRLGWVQKYVVTDCDIDLTIADKDALIIYSRVLDKFPLAKCVGPMLRISDIPQTYPLYKEVMSRHIKQFWHRHPEWLELDGIRIASQEAFIDTTFALYRAGDKFERLGRGRRIYYPYEARHLDWYLGSEDFGNTVYSKTASYEIAHWNVDGGRSNENLEFKEFWCVTRNEKGELIEEVKDISF
jgi:glycosyltransferase involved in cell wall biosynthesis